MMERAKTAPAPEETQSNTNNKSSAPSSSTQPTEERVNDIQRRLNNLDTTTTNTATSNSSDKSDVVKSGETLVEQVKQQSQTGKNNPLLVSKLQFRTAPLYHYMSWMHDI